jgi:putative restriction endonuclease
MEQQLPLVYFYRVQPGQYLAAFPVYIVGDDPERLSFDVQVDDVAPLARPPEELDAVSEDRAGIRREYVTSIVRRRLHQQAFRARVIEAYRVRRVSSRRQFTAWSLRRPSGTSG